MRKAKKRRCSKNYRKYVKRLESRVRKSLCLDLKVDDVPLCIYSTAHDNYYALCQEWLLGPYSSLNEVVEALQNDLVEWDDEKDEPKDGMTSFEYCEVREAIRDFVDENAGTVAFSSAAAGGCPGSDGGELWCLKLDGLYWYVGGEILEVYRIGEIRGQWPFDNEGELDATPWYEGYSEVGLDDLAREYEPGRKIRHDGVLMVLTTDGKFMEVEDQ